MGARRLIGSELPPDVFAIVMATGIVSVAASDHAYHLIADVLAALAAAAFVLLALGVLVRVGASPRRALGDLGDPDVVLRLFTFVAACSVLGARFTESTWAVVLFGVLAAASWLTLAPVALRDLPSRTRIELRDSAHGAWLLPAVATAGLSITAADLATQVRAGAFVPVAAAAWLLALVIYAAVTWLIGWRALAAPLVPEAVTPDSWILMGALAIATLAGAHVIAAVAALHSSGYAWVQPLTLAVWAGSAAWIPLLLYVELWSFGRRSGALHYSRVWWSAVFPAGMFSAATAAAAAQLGIRPLATVSLVFFWLAFAFWLCIAAGLARTGIAREAAWRRSGAHHDRFDATR